MVVFDATDGTKIRIKSLYDGYVVQVKPRGKWFYRNFIYYDSLNEAWRNAKLLQERLS